MVRRIFSGMGDDWLLVLEVRELQSITRRGLGPADTALARLGTHRGGPRHREPDDDDEAMAPTGVARLGAWRPPPYYHGQSLQARRIHRRRSREALRTGEFADVWPSITNDPALRDITQPSPNDQLTFRSRCGLSICSVLPLLPLIAGLSHTLLDVGGFGIGVACSTWRPTPVLWLLGLLFRAGRGFDRAVAGRELRSGSAIFMTEDDRGGRGEACANCSRCIC